MSSLTGALARNTYTAPSANPASNFRNPLLRLPQELIAEIMRQFFAGTTHRVSYHRPPSRVRQGKSGLSILRASRLLSPSAIKAFYSLSKFRHYVDLNRPFRMHAPSQDLVDLIQHVSFELVLPTEGLVTYIGNNRMRYPEYLNPCFEATLALFANTSIPRKACRLILPICQDCQAIAGFLTSPFFRALKHLRGFQTLNFEVRDALYPARATLDQEELAQANRQKAWAMLYILRPALEAALGPSVDGAWREFDDGGGRRCEFAVVFRPREAVAEGTVGGGEDDEGLYEVPPGPWPEGWEERYVELCGMYMVEGE